MDVYPAWPATNPGAPYLARFSRDVGFHCTATGIRPGGKGATNGRPPHLAKNQRDMGHPGWWQAKILNPIAPHYTSLVHRRWKGMTRAIATGGWTLLLLSTLCGS